MMPKNAFLKMYSIFVYVPDDLKEYCKRPTFN